MKKNINRGFLIKCNLDGYIKEIAQDYIDISEEAVIDTHITTLADKSNFGKMLNFLVELRSSELALGWQINIALNEKIETFNFGGIVLDKELLVFGAKTKDGVMKLYEKLMEIHNEQSNKLRNLVKKQTKSIHMEQTDEKFYYEEMSRLNNELSNLQRELTKKNIELKQLNETKNKFIGMAAHDLRNPLGIIKGYSDFLMEEATPILNDKHVKFLNFIHRSSKFLLKLVDDLLDAAKIESGNLDLDLREVNIKNHIKGNISLNEILASKKDMEIEFTHDDSDSTVYMDPAKINQVLNNLISNAIKYSHPETKIQINLQQRDDFVEISVHDEGQGIPEEEMHKLFKPFSKTTVQTTGGELSTGLGLMISKNIVEGHGGKIWVESVEGEGSTFYFTIPLDPKTVINAAFKDNR